jgi:hypothetical protein
MSRLTAPTPSSSPPIRKRGDRQPSWPSVRLKIFAIRPDDEEAEDDEEDDEKDDEDDEKELGNRQS